MPFISRLKKLGTLSVPELQTTLTAYLINLEHSPETNLVYTSSNPIPADATPPADLRFECYEGYTKRGDVLIWASRVHKKACFVHACWVFDGHGWTKPNSDSEIMMDHPVHSDYQLVILSGPYVKWELKPDPDREPSLTVPDPPPLRLGARGSMNTILPSSSSLPPTQNTENSDHTNDAPCPRPRSSDIASNTPDGSAAMCSSSRFSTPLSDIPEDAKPEISHKEASSHTMPISELLTGHDTALAPPLPRTNRIESAHSLSPVEMEVHATIPESSRSPPTDKTSFSRGRRDRPKGARSISSARATPVTGAPPTPDSSMRTRTRRHARPETVTNDPSKASPSPRRRKRQRTVDDDDFIPTSSRTLSSTSHPDTLPPAKRRRLGKGPNRTSRVRLMLPALAPLSDSKDVAGGSQNDVDSDSSEGEDSFWDQLEELQRDKDKLAIQVKEAVDLAAAHSKLVREVKDRDDLIEQLRHQLVTVQPTALNSETAASLEARLAEQQDKAAKEVLSFRRWKVEASEKQKRVQDELDAASLQIRQWQDEKFRAEASSYIKPAVEEQLTLLRNERDHACRLTDEVRADLAEVRKQRDIALSEAQDSKRAANDIAIARAGDVTVALRNIRQLEDQKKQLETELVQSKTDFEARLAFLRSESDKTYQDVHSQGQPPSLQQNKLEETVGQLDEQRRRAASFEASLRVAQEALQRQRTHAQETEALQRRTISQLAKELQEKDHIAKELADKSEVLERQIEELQQSLLMKDNTLQGEVDALRRAKIEIDQIKEMMQADRLRIADLQATVAADRKEIVVASDQAYACQILLDQIRQEKEACNAVLAEEVRMRTDLEAQLFESHRSRTALEGMHKSVEECLIQERTAKHTLESQIETQHMLFQDHISASDRERGRLEELLLERRSSLQLDLKSKMRDLESAQGECTRLKVERSVEREQFCAELAACRERQAEATEARDDMEVEVKRYKAELALSTQSLDHARLDFAASRSTMSTERDRLAQELSKTQNRLEKMVSDSERQLAESLGNCQRVERELSALQVQFHSQSRDLESAKARCLQLQADAESERQDLVSQISSINTRLEEQRNTSQGQMAAVREEHKAAEQNFQAQRASLELEACRVAELLKCSQEEFATSQTLLRTDRARFEEELTSNREKLSSLESLLVTAKQERSDIEGRLAQELLLKDQAFSHNILTLKELEDVRADLVRITAELAATHQSVQDAVRSQESLKEELTACQSALLISEEAGKREQDRVVMESCSIANELKETRLECSRLREELASEREGFRAERSLSSDGLRSKLSSVEARLVLERATSQSLRKQLTLAKEEPSTFWSDLSSQLLRSLHDVQDQLKVEQIARQALQDELVSERLKGGSLEACEPLQNKV